MSVARTSATPNMRVLSSELGHQSLEGEKRCLNSELWHACAGPLISLPAVGSRVVYFPQGHSEQVAASTNKEVDGHIPNYPNLPPQLICQLHNVTMHADVETDEVYAQMTLQPLSPDEQKESYLPADLSGLSKQPTNYFCKTLTASDTSTHGGFSVPRRAAEKVFPPLDFSQQPPCQELIAKDLHDNEWKFRHIFRGQPKRHLLTTGWSVFVSAKRLVAGDSVLFIWNENNQLLLGIRRANRPQTVMPSSVLSSDSMHIGLLAAAAHAASTNSRFTIFYNPRASPSEFVIPLAKYVKAIYHTRVSVGMRFRMLFETEESSVRRYMGTITAISDLHPVRWPNSHWRSVKVGWDESTAAERQPRVSLWEIEPLTTFPMYPSSFPLRLKRPWPSGLPSLNGMRDDGMGLNSPLMWLHNAGDWRTQSLNFQGGGISPWMQPRFDSTLLGMQPEMYQAMAHVALQEMRGTDTSRQTPAMLQFQQPQNFPNGSAPILPNQVLQQMPQQASFQNIYGGFNQAKQQLPRQSQQNIPPPPQQQQQQQFSEENHQHQTSQQQDQPPLKKHQPNNEMSHELPNEQSPHVVSNLSQLVSGPISTHFQQQNFLDSSVNPVTTADLSALNGSLSSFFPGEASRILNLQMSNPLVSSGGWVPKRIGIDAPLSAGDQCVMPQFDHLGLPQTSISQPSAALPRYNRKDCQVDQDPSGDAQNNLLFGVNIDPSLLGQNGITNMRNIVTRTPSTTTAFASDFLTAAESGFPLNPAITSLSCLDESRFIQTPENVGQVNSQNGTFVKVYKSGSFGRSLDISRFSSYPELWSELGRMFGLEGQLDDPLRSGWQLVFIDREDDILLVGDGPWQEFVNNVYCIKILSPQDVLQMGKQGLDSTSSITVNRLSSSSCDEYVSKQDS